MSVEIRPLTSLRFLLAMWVLLYHLRDLWAAPAAVERVMALGYLAVPGFFVLSGVVLAWTYLQGNAPQVPAPTFLRARAARIVPLYLLGLLVALPLYLAKGVASGFAIVDLVPPVLLALVMLQAWFPSWALLVNSPGWSISVEAFFYAVFPWVGAWLRRRSTAAVLGLTCGGVLVSALGIVAWSWVSDLQVLGVDAVADPANHPLIDAARFHPLAHVTDFLLGVGLGILLARHGRTAVRAAGPGLVLGLLGLALLAGFAHALPYVLVNGPLAVCCFAGVILGLACLPETHVLHRVLAWPPLLLLGRASFALYILHLPLIDWGWQAAKWFAGPQPSTSLFAWVCLPVLVAFSVLGHLLVEEPLRRRLGVRRPSATPSVRP